MAPRSREGHIVFLLTVGLLGWFVPGAGHLAIKEKKHAIIIFATIALTFATGLYIGSIGIINPVGAKPWYIAQLMNSPAVAILGQLTRTGDYPLNLLCIVNAVYWAHLRETEPAGE